VKCKIQSSGTANETANSFGATEQHGILACKAFDAKRTNIPEAKHWMNQDRGSLKSKTKTFI
jgi:hypothetical protein